MYIGQKVIGKGNSMFGPVKGKEYTITFIRDIGIMNTCGILDLKDSEGNERTSYPSQVTDIEGNEIAEGDV